MKKHLLVAGIAALAASAFLLGGHARPVSAANSGGQVQMYRLYNPNSGEHFYTQNNAERKQLVHLGWNFEGVGWIAPGKSSTPVYRLYNKNGGEHHYTMSAGERDVLRSKGWRYEGIGWYSDDKKTTPLYRDYNPHAFANNHNYTTNAGEHTSLNRIGWKNEGTAWYGISAGTNGRINSKNTKGLTSQPFVAYLTGLDTRTGNVSDDTHSDANVVAVVNPSTKRIAFIGIPRDTYVQNPAMKNAYDRFTLTSGYGINNIESVVQNMLNVNIDGYCRMTFKGFAGFIDAIGGVTVNSEQAFSGSASLSGRTYNFRRGANNLSGDAALAFARERHAFDGRGEDLQRNKDQMLLLEGVVSKLSNSSNANTMNNLPSICRSLGDQLGTSFTTDQISSFAKFQTSSNAKWTASIHALTGTSFQGKKATNPSKTATMIRLSSSSVHAANEAIMNVIYG